MNSAIMEKIWNELLPDSPWAEGIRQEGREAGREEGRQEGELREARQSVLRLLRNRFPEIEAPSLDAVTGLQAIHDAFDHLLQASTADRARAILSDLTER